MSPTCSLEFETFFESILVCYTCCPVCKSFLCFIIDSNLEACSCGSTKASKLPLQRLTCLLWLHPASPTVNHSWSTCTPGPCLNAQYRICILRVDSCRNWFPGETSFRGKSWACWSITYKKFWTVWAIPLPAPMAWKMAPGKWGGPQTIVETFAHSTEQAEKNKQNRGTKKRSKRNHNRHQQQIHKPIYKHNHNHHKQPWAFESKTSGEDTKHWSSTTSNNSSTTHSTTSQSQTKTRSDTSTSCTKHSSDITISTIHISARQHQRTAISISTTSTVYTHKTNLHTTNTYINSDFWCTTN